MYVRREALMMALIKEQRKHIDSGEEVKCYLEFLLSLEKQLTEKQIMMLLWEVIIETSDSMLVATEWDLYELAKNSKQQVFFLSLLSALRRNVSTRNFKVCANLTRLQRKNLSQLPYLSAVFHETLRKHSHVPIMPLRYAHEDTQIRGYDIPAGSEIAINVYACSMDKRVWEDPEEWKPERFLKKENDTMDLNKTMAFGGGKRVCAGSLETFFISCVTIGRLIQEFEWRLKDGEEDNVHTLGLTTKKLHPMRAIIKPRI
ncbi:hypothetical protein LguiB_017253 [Lonicera macranthoides]